MTATEMNCRLARQAEDLSTLVAIKGINLRVLNNFLENSKKYGKGVIDPVILRMAFRLRLMHDCYAFVLGYISEDELIDSMKWFESFSYKFWERGEYSQLTPLTKMEWYKKMGMKFPFEGYHISLRPARLLPQY